MDMGVSVFTHFICWKCDDAIRRTDGVEAGWTHLGDGSGLGNAQCPACAPASDGTWSLGEPWTRTSGGVW